MKAGKINLIKASSIAVALIMTITLLGYYAISDRSVYAMGMVDHKKIGQGYRDGELQIWYTVSIRLFDDDPINGFKSGDTPAYIITKDEWEMVEWGDTANLRILPELRAEIVRLFPALKLPKWHGLVESPISIEMVANKSTYTLGEKASFSVKIKNVPEEKDWVGSSTPLKLTLFKAFPFWIFRDGEKMFSSYNNLEFQEIVLQPDQELMFSFEWELVDDHGRTVPKGVYYVRVYLGFFTEDEEISLTGTTMIGIEN